MQRVGISVPHATPEMASHFEQTAQHALVHIGDASQIHVSADGHGVTFYADVIDGSDDKLRSHFAMLNAQEDESMKTFLVVCSSPAPAHQ